jgi:hypothetical protein
MHVLYFASSLPVSWRWSTFARERFLILFPLGFVVQIGCSSTVLSGFQVVAIATVYSGQPCPGLISTTRGCGPNPQKWRCWAELGHGKTATPALEVGPFSLQQPEEQSQPPVALPTNKHAILFWGSDNPS